MHPGLKEPNNFLSYYTLRPQAAQTYFPQYLDFQDLKQRPQSVPTRVNCLKMWKKPEWQLKGSTHFWIIDNTLAHASRSFFFFFKKNYINFLLFWTWFEKPTPQSLWGKMQFKIQSRFIYFNGNLTPKFILHATQV